MKEGALCGLGQLTPGPVLSALRYFEEEFKTNILGKEIALPVPVESWSGPVVPMPVRRKWMFLPLWH